MGAQRIGSAGVKGMMRRALQEDRGIEWVNLIAGPEWASESAVEDYPFIGNVPAMREWIGGRDVYDFNEAELSVRNTHFEATIRILLKELRRDKTGSLRMRIRELAQKSGSHWASHLSTLILNGETGKSYDGKAFYASDHEWGDSGPQSNSISVDISALPAQVHGSPTAPSPEEAQQSILAGIAQIASLKDDRAEPMNETMTDIAVMTGTGLAPAVRAGLTKDVSVSAGTFDFGGFRVRQFTNVRLNTHTSKIHVFRTDGMSKALHRQQEGSVQIKSKAEGSDFEFDNDAHEYGVDVWRKGFYAYWQYACLVTLT